jgi:PAS domain-containing protein
MVSVFADDARTRLRTLAVHFDGQPAPNFEYEVAGSPCERVVGQDYRYVRAGVLAQLDPHDAFAAAGLDAFAAFPLTDSAGTPLGVLAALDRQPIARGDAEHAETMLKVVAGRLVAELERRAATEALRQSEASYRTIFDSAELAIYVHDWDSGLLTDANPRACADHRMSREELLRADPHLLTGSAPRRVRSRPSSGGSSTRGARCAGTRSRSSPHRSTAAAASSPTGATSPSASSPKRNCARARNSTARSSTPAKTRWCCGTTSFAAWT